MLEQNAALLKECRIAFDGWERFAQSRPGYLLVFAWALAEATFWPIIPDFLLVLVVAGNRQRFYKPLAFAIAGAALGGIMMFLFAYLVPNEALAMLRYLPFARESQFHTVSAQFASNGALAFFYQPWSGIQFKVWALIGGSQGIAPWLAIPCFIVARALRMAVFATLARLLVGRFTSFVRDNSLYLAALYMVFFFFNWWQVIVL